MHNLLDEMPRAKRWALIAGIIFLFSAIFSLLAGDFWISIGNIVQALIIFLFYNACRKFEAEQEENHIIAICRYQRYLLTYLGVSFAIMLIGIVAGILLPFLG